MHVKVIGGCGTEIAWARSGCLLVDDRVAFDCGGLASQLSLLEQVAVDHVFLTHAHLDHVGELAFLADNVMTARSEPVKVWAPAPVLDTLRRHLFNDQLWPDFSKIVINARPVVEFCPLVGQAAVCLGGLRIRWAQTSHTVDSVGYLVEDAVGTLLYSGDTGPTEALWTLANDTVRLHTVFIEAAFPNRLQNLAAASGHLTPALLKQELDKLQRHEAKINVMHVKPVYFEEICRELESLQRPWQIVAGGEIFIFKG